MADIKTAAEVCKSQRIPENSVRFKACEAFVAQCNEQVKAGRSTFTLMTTKGAYPEQKGAAACYLSARLAAIQDHLPEGFKSTEQPSQPATKEEVKTPQKELVAPKDKLHNPDIKIHKNKKRVSIDEFANMIAGWEGVSGFRTSELMLIDENKNGFFELGVDRLFSRDARVDVPKNDVLGLLDEYCVSQVPKGFLFKMTPRAEKKIKEMTAKIIYEGNGNSYPAAELETYELNGQTCQWLRFETSDGAREWDSCSSAFVPDRQACAYFGAQPEIDFLDGHMMLTMQDDDGTKSTIKAKPKY